MKDKAITPARGMQFMLVFVLFDSSAGVFIKLLPWNPFVIAGIRSAIAFIFLLIYYKSMGIKIVVTRNSVLAGLMISAMFITFIAATRLTTAANAIALQFSNPFFIIILSLLLFKQKPSKKDLLTVTGVLIGIVFIFGGSFTLDGMPGNTLALFSGLCLAGMLIFNNRVKDQSEHYSALVLGHGITFLAGSYFIFVYPPSLNAGTISFVLALGILQQVIPNILYAYAIRVCRPLVCSLIMMLQLILNPVLVFLAVGEIPSFMEITGCAIILSVCVWTLLNKESKSSNISKK